MKTKAMLRRTVALLLSLLLSCLWLPAVYAQDILPQQSHAQRSFESLAELSFQLEEFQALAEEVTTLCTDEANASAVTEKLLALREMYLTLDTLMAIAEAASNYDVTDLQANTASIQYLEWYYTENECLGDTVTAVLDSPCADCVDQDDLVFSLYLMGDYDYSDEERALCLAEQTLMDSYSEAMAGEFNCSLNGKSMTAEEVYDAWYYDEIDESEYDACMTELARAENAAVVDYYLQLVENRNAQAALYDYDCAADYYDDYTYYRDYGSREREAFYDAVKTEIVPLVDQLFMRVQLAYSRMDGEDTGYSGEELLTMLRQGIESVSGELLPACDYMTEYGYYVIDSTETMADTCYTTILPEPNAPFLFFRTSGWDSDFSSIVHEFGHYNAYYCSDDIYASNYELAEIHSQGLELLMLKEYPELFGEKEAYEELYTIYNILYSLVDGCLYDELERYAYAEENLTAEKLNRRYMELLKEYGYREETDPEEEAYDWVEIPHLFTSPMYYISYAVSAAGALSLWETSLTDYDGAVETYLSLVALGEEGALKDTLKSVGMKSPLSDQAVSAVAEAVAGCYGLYRSGYDVLDAGSWSEDELGQADTVLVLAVALVLINAIAGVTTAAVLAITGTGRKRS